MEWAGLVLVLPYLKWETMVWCCWAQAAVIATAEVAGTTAAAQVEGGGGGGGGI